MKTIFFLTLVALLTLLANSSRVGAQGTAFTYDGRLTDGGSPATGLYEMSFALYDALANGNTVGTPVALAPVPVTNGLFTVLLDFGAGVFPGADRWLDIAVRTNGGGAFTNLTPRHPITATPYAITAGDVTGANIARLNVPNTAQQATADVPTVTGGFVTAANVAFGGSGYTTPPAVTVNDATGSGAVITAIVSGGQVTALTVNNAGSGYSAGATLTIGVPPSNAYQTFPGTNFFLNPGNTFAGDGSGLTGLWRTSGNTGTTPGTHFLGTTDNQALEFRVNNTRALRLEPGGSNSVNVIGGWAGNGVAPGVAGATVAGGGAGDWFGLAYINGVEAHFGTVSGGSANTIQANADAATIGGGLQNTIQTDAIAATIGGGGANTIQANAAVATIGGGDRNTIQTDAIAATIGGGFLNTIQTNAEYATIGGGDRNRIQTNADNATIGGGYSNLIQPNANDATIGGGRDNTIQPDAASATIGGGSANMIQTNASRATIGGGDQNTIQPNSYYATIGGGVLNKIQPNAYAATIGGGEANLIQTNSDFATIGGGDVNKIQPNANSATIGGGFRNTVQLNADFATIGGGYVNTIQTNAEYATIGGGRENTIQTNADYATIGGGRENTIQTNAYAATIGGGQGNTIQTDYAAIGGGNDNTIQTDAEYATIGGGKDNQIQTNADYATIGGGIINTIQTNAHYATIGGGFLNTIQLYANYATIGGGLQNTIQTNAHATTIGGGQGNIISNGVLAATIPGGNANSAGGDYGFAAGRRAKANHQGAFVWADSSSFDFGSTAGNQFNVRAVGGVRIVTGVDGSGTPDRGVSLNANDTSWHVISDRSAKKNFRPADGREILERLARLPIQHWNYKWETAAAVPHLGPTAQDFKAAFYPGRDDKTISTLEADGVALAAIQGLNQKLTEELKRRDTENADLKQRLEKLEQLMNHQNGGVR